MNRAAFLHRAGLAVWLGMIALAGLLVGLAWINGQGIETDIRRAFGVTATDDVDRWLEDQTAASLCRTCPGAS